MLEELIGQTLDRYQITQLLGQGGMGAVFRARDLALQRDVAIKVMQPLATQEPSFQERFLQEARTAARLDHPGIVKVYDFGQALSFLYIVMELIPGDNVRKLLQHLQAAQQWIALPEAVGLVRQVCLAVDYAHRQGILHRDIKPDNIMLKPEPADDLPYRPVLTDLGLAKLVEGGMLTQEGMSMGTPSYMSPEQALGEKTDARSDVYSLGILLYELAVGRLPFPIRTLTEAIRYHTKEPPPPPRSLRPDLPEALERVILRALAKSPADRFPDAKAMAEALAAPTATTTEVATHMELVNPATQVEQVTPRPRGPSILAEFPQPPSGLGQDRISVLAPDGRIRSQPITSGQLSIGRAPDNDVVLDQGTISQHHARVQFDGADYRVIDLDSTNGTFLANVRLLPGVPVVWTPDKALRIGESWLRLERAPVVTQGAGTLVGQTLAPSAPGARRVGAFIETTELAVDPGSTATLSVVVLNQGPIVDHFRVSLLNLPADWLPTPPSLIRLLPGTQQQLDLAIRPPRSPQSRAGRYAFTVQVASQDAPGQVAEVGATLTVSAFQQFEVDLRPQRQSGPGSAIFRLQISNWGNGDLVAELAASDAEEACSFRFEPPQASVPAGGESVMQLIVTPRATPRLHRFTVTIRPTAAPWLARQVQGEWEELPQPASTLAARPPAEPRPAAQATRAAGCGFWGLWVLLSTLAGALAAVLAANLDLEPLGSVAGEAGVRTFLVGLAGLFLGAWQWLLLRSRLRRSGWWIVATVAAFALDGAALSSIPSPYERSLMGALLIGTTQWLVLQGSLRWSGLWVLASAVGWHLADRFNLLVNPLVGGSPLLDAVEMWAASTGPVAGLDPGRVRQTVFWLFTWSSNILIAAAITGVALVWLLGRPAARGPTEPSATATGRLQ